VKKISSTLTANFAFNYLDYKRDQFGNKQLNERGDTIIQSVNQSYIVGLPFDLELPMILNIGAVHPITENWDAALDIVDLTEKDIRFENYLERIRIGSEYRQFTSDSYSFQVILESYIFFRKINNIQRITWK